MAPPGPCAPSGRHPPSSHVTPSRAWHTVEAQSLFAECEPVIVSKRPGRWWRVVAVEQRWQSVRSSDEGAGGAAPLAGESGTTQAVASWGRRQTVPWGRAAFRSRSDSGSRASSGGSVVLGDVGCRVWRVPGVSSEACAELCVRAGTTLALTGDVHQHPLRPRACSRMSSRASPAGPRPCPARTIS